MKRREILKWTTPLVVAVVIPAHATTSEIVATTPLPTTTVIPPSPTLPPDYCKDGDVMMCKTGEVGIYNTICAAPDEVQQYLDGGYTLGMCPSKQ